MGGPKNKQLHQSSADKVSKTISKKEFPPKPLEQPRKL